MARLALVLTLVLVLAAGCSGSRKPESGLALTQAIEFQTDEPAPSVSQSPGKVTVVVRAVNHDTKTHRFIAHAVLTAQDGSTIAVGSQPVTLKGTSGTLVRFDIPNPQNTPVFGTDFEVELPQTTVNVGLIEFSVKPDKTTVTHGPIKFVAHNESKSMVHELAVVRVKDDGSLDELGDVEALTPGKTGSFTLDLPPGHYQLACLIAPGEEGSTVDHYQQGMHTDFTVTP
jgi:uncharacterized cupredoxin-like copper-binding protein